MSIIKAENLGFNYVGEDSVNIALSNLNLEIASGEFVCILGRNGSGKSTFARQINALLTPSSGTMEVCGWVTSDEAHIFDIRRSAGVVFQNPDNQLVATVVEEDVAFGPENLGLPQPEIIERVNDALNAVNMSEYRLRAPHLLSGGQKQRIAIAGLLAMNPDILVLDEATAMLDPSGRAEVLAIAEKLHKQGKTIVMITHFIEEAENADRIFILENGILAQTGSPRDIFWGELPELLPPFAVDTAKKLIENGIKIDDRPLTTAELASSICKNKFAPLNTNDEQPPGADDAKDSESNQSTPINNGQELIRLEDVTYTYAPGSPFSHTAVKNINLSISPGEFIGIIGHTGSGKSTLLQIAAGLLAPNSGKVLANSEDVFSKNYDKSKLRKLLGVVFQYPEYSLFCETVASDIAFGPEKQGISGDALTERVFQAMEKVGLDYNCFAHRSPFELSGGQKRKVAIAGVLAMNTPVLMLDEPISGLDPAGRTQLMELLKKLNESGVTIVMVSHNMEGLAQYAGRIIAMSDGEIILDDTPEVVFSREELLSQNGLKIPEAAGLAQILSEFGIEMPKCIITEEQLVAELSGRVL